jgi:S1-C subfamily serine protease
MSSEFRSAAPLIILILVAGLYAGYAVAVLASPLAGSNQYLAQRVGALEGIVAALQSQINDLEHGNSTASDCASLNDIYTASKGSIVTITGLAASSPLLGGYSEVLGSGFVVNLTGECLVVTNFHVVDGLVNASMTFVDGESYTFDVLGADKYSDLAVLRPHAPASKLKPLAVVSSSTLLVGDSVVAIGNPYGLQSTLTSGIVSQLNRAIRTETAGSYTIAGVIQISAPINPGNSGGPLFDSQGRVVGITTAIISGSQNVGFAVPSDTIVREIVALSTAGHYQHPYLGITGVSNSYLISQALGLQLTYGVLIQTVTAGSPAASAGLQGGTYTATVGGSNVSGGGDLIVSIDGRPTIIIDDMTSLLDAYLPGQNVSITVLRGGEYLVLPAVLGARP